MLGTLNFIDEAKRVEAAALVDDGRGVLAVAVVRHERPAEGLAPPHQPGAHHDRHRRGRRARQPGLPARHRRRGRRHRDAAAVLDPVGRPRPHLRPRQGLERPRRRGRRHERGRPGHGHRARGIRHRLPRRAARRRPRARTRTGRTTASCRTATRSPPPTSTRPSPLQGPSSKVGRGDIVLVRTGQLARARRDGWGDYAGGPAPGLSFTHRRLAAPHRDRRDRHRHVGLRGAAERVRRPPSSRCTRSSSRTSGSRSARCGTSTASPRPARQTAGTTSCSPRRPLPITGAVGSPINPVAIQ